MQLDEMAKIRGELFDVLDQHVTPLKVGPMSATVVHAHDGLGFRLLRYATFGQTPSQRIKLLIVPHIVNRPYILDFSSEISVIRSMCTKNIDVYMIDWGYPTSSQSHISFAHYVRYVDLAADMLANAQPIVLGYCTGGIIALIWASRHTQKLKALISMATPVDFSEWTDPRLLWGKVFDVRWVCDHFGNIPGEMINFIGMQLFVSFLPLFAVEEEFWDEFVDHAALWNSWRKWRWLADAQAIPRRAYQQFIEDCYRNNLLIQNRLRVDGRPVDLTRIKCPVLNILARYDHIVPISSAAALRRVYQGQDYREIRFPSSHVGLSTSRKAMQMLWPQVIQWIKTKA